jgi:hypothetical protein
MSFNELKEKRLETLCQSDIRNSIAAREDGANRNTAHA